jgi:hypothetical protein
MPRNIEKNNIMVNIKLSLLALFGILSFNIAYSQWLDPQLLKSTVLLEKIQNNSFVPHGTGILMYNYNNPSELIVVTCAHLIRDKKQISVRVKPDSNFIKVLSQTGQKQLVINNAIVIGNTLRFLASLESDNCFIHPTLDIAAFRLIIPPAIFVTDTSRTRIEMSKLLGIPKSGLEFRKDLLLGDEVYFIGFPLGYGATNLVEPIVRSGSIAWLPEEENIFLLDAFSFGGNSGSPIFRKRIIGSKVGELSWSGSTLIGMIIGHQSIQIENILNQPNQNELKFEITDIDLNIGLSSCVYIDDIIETINMLSALNNN